MTSVLRLPIADSISARTAGAVSSFAAVIFCSSDSRLSKISLPRTPAFCGPSLAAISSISPSDAASTSFS